MSGKKNVNSEGCLEEWISRAEKFCAFQERCIFDLRKKLLSQKCPSEFIEKVVSEMIKERFLDENRYASAFAGGKLRNNQWGRIRISNELRYKGLSEVQIKEAIGGINEDEYRNILKKLIKSKWASLGDSDVRQKRIRTAQFLIGKGFEKSLVFSELNIGEDFE